ncbi:hypothetical protein R5R35_014479 [Gryllus longicercus]|uniref:VLRF1 domain-containing protein n=1 Tax=Gryllus longicercus TaxID=2509291 RepID=A0AAN9Z467_9ORTH
MDHQVYSIFDEDNFVNLTKGLKIAQCMKSEDDVQEESKEVDPVNKRMEELFVSDKLFCSFCNVAFEDKFQQRLHYKLDWHRYNLKQNLIGRSFVTEEEFQHLADDVSSISGSETDSEDNEENEDNSEVSLKNTETQNNLTSQKLQIERHCKVFFENVEGKILSIYRCVLHDKKMGPDNDNDLVTSALQSIEKPTWAVIMLGGGHFAAAVFQGKEAIVHKSFHSYTVRARQGGAQSSRDGRSGGSHPKSAGASLRRYNEASFNQHIQDILTEWISHLEACSLILCRAVGHNRHILFGGRNPPLSKTDPRLRTIPFSTRRATFKEVQRVHATISSLEIYGNAKDFQSSFPVSPKKIKSKTLVDRKDDATQQSDNVETVVAKEEGVSAETKEEREGRFSRSPSQKKPINRAKSRPSPHRPLPEIVTEILAQSSPEVSDIDDGEIRWSGQDEEISLQHDLQEFEDTVPQWVKDKKTKKQSKQVKKKKSDGKDSKKVEKCSEAVRILRQKLLAACKLGNTTLLQECLKIERNDTSEISSEDKKTNNSNNVTHDELLGCLNEHVTDNGSTLLHIAAENGNTGMLRSLLEAGCDPSLKNKKSQAPFAVSVDRETRNAFRKFMGEFPDKYDYRKSQIPGPLTDEMERELAEKQKELRKAKRAKERERKKEETEKDRFLKLSDREKRALAAERRILESNAQGRSNIKVVTRCFECAVDITGKVPFEYDIHRFCTMECLKRHRQKMKLDQK